MKFAIFYVTAIAAIVFGFDGAAAVAAPPRQIDNGPVLNRVEYIYYNAVGTITGSKIYDCTGWVVSWGEKDKYTEIKITPCN